MKKAAIFFLFFWLLVTARGYAQEKRVAVISFYLENRIKASDEPVPAKDSVFNVLPLLKHFHDQFFKNLVQELPFAVIPEHQVLGNSDYQNFIPGGNSVEDILAFKNEITVPGYKIILSQKKPADEQAMLQLFPDCDGVMEVRLDLSLETRGFGGMSLVKANARATFLLFNKSGRKMLTLTENALSPLSGTHIAGIPFMTARHLLPLCESAVNELITVMQHNLPDDMRKAAAKL
ncbi:MAG TPA: hypothetical protein VHA56_18020 [Mucilaginibacter sp.]|nr:hypothetical protein [Mucilaginibacter sp.]